MIKAIVRSLSMLMLLGGVIVSAEAQNGGDIEFSLVFGNNTMLNQNTTEYLLPKYNTSSATPGTGILRRILLTEYNLTQCLYPKRDSSKVVFSRTLWEILVWLTTCMWDIQEKLMPTLEVS